MFSKLVFSFVIALSFNSFGIQDPNSLLPQIDAYMQESFSQAFDRKLSYDFHSESCEGNNSCSKFFMRMLINPVDENSAVIDMLDENGSTFGSRSIHASQWSQNGSSAFHMSLVQQKSKYSEIEIREFRDAQVYRHVNGQRRLISAKEIIVFLRNTSETTNKVFTVTNQLPGYVKLLGVHDKQQVPQPKSIARMMDHIWY